MPTDYRIRAEQIALAERPVSRGSSAPRWWFYLPPVIPFLFLFLTSYVGRDYGRNPNESRLMETSERSLRDGVLLPIGSYNDPSLSYWISVASALPARDVLGSLPKDYVEGASPRTALQGERDSVVQSYRLRARTAFAFLTSLAVFWIYFAVLRWRRNVWTASVASATLAVSWAIAYHARWMAPDAVMTQFATLALWCSFEIRRSDRPQFWADFGAITVGLCGATTYAGFLLAIPVLIAIVRRFQSQGSGPSARARIFRFLPGVIGTYLVVTPGTLLEPLDFMNNVRYEVLRYRTGDFGHTIAPGLPHVQAIFGFVSFSLFSHYPSLSFAIFAVAVVGSIWLVVNEQIDAWTLLCFPVLYVSYLSLQHVFFAGDLLVLAPFLACLLAFAIEVIIRHLPKSIRPILWTGVAACLVINGVWLIMATRSIGQLSKNQIQQRFFAYVAASPKKKIWLSPELKKLAPNATPNIANSIQEADFVATHPQEPFLLRTEWPASQWNLVTDTFGPEDVDFNYYPDWPDEDRIVVLTKDKAVQNLPSAFLAGSSDRQKFLPITYSVPRPPQTSR